jgi:hypothetical protein
LLLSSGSVIRRAVAAKHEKPGREAVMQAFCRPLGEINLDSPQSPEDIVGTPLIALDGQLFIVGVNYNVTAFSSRKTGAGGRRQYVLEQLDPSKLVAIRSIRGDAAAPAFAAFGVGLLEGEDELYLLNHGELSLIENGLKVSRPVLDLAGTISNPSVIRSGDYLAIIAGLVRNEMRYDQLWVWDIYNHRIVYQHEVPLGSVLAGLDASGGRVLLATAMNGFRQITFPGGADRRVGEGFPAPGYPLSCGDNWIGPIEHRYSSGAWVERGGWGYVTSPVGPQITQYGGFAIIPADGTKFRKWYLSGRSLQAETCEGGEMLALAGEVQTRSVGHGRSGVFFEHPEIARLNLQTFKSDTVPVNLPPEPPLASAWLEENQRLYVMTTGHVCAIASSALPR